MNTEEVSMATRTRAAKVEVSLTSFTDFLLRVGVRKLSAAERIWHQYIGGYRHYQDYYREFREHVVAVHKQGRPVIDLDQLPALVAPARGKQKNYQLMVRGWQRAWLTHYQELGFRWVTPPRGGRWVHRRLHVRTNPELAFSDGRETHLVKLYLKKEPPNKEQVRLILHLMQIALHQRAESAIVSVIDVRRAKQYIETAFDPRLTVLLEAESEAFLRICRSLQDNSELLTSDPDE